MRRITPAHDGVTMPGEAIAITSTSSTSSPVSGTTGRSRNNPRTAARLDGWRAAVAALMRPSGAAR